MKKILNILFRRTILIILAAILSTDGLAADKKLSLNLKSVPISTVLSMISEQHGLNIVVNADIKGAVTLRLNEVDLNTALASILNPNGYNYYYDNDIIVVKSMERETAAELVTEVIRLSYAEAAAIKQALESIKSDRGSVVILDPSVEGSGYSAGKYTPTQLLVTDYPVNVSQMLALVADLDKAERIVSIEVKIIETTIDDQTKLGFSWPSSLSSKISGQLNSGSTTITNVDQSSDVLGSKNLNGGQWVWGTLSVSELRVVLDALSATGNSRLLSDPKITTAENHEAEIKSQTVIPIQTINRFTESAATADIVSYVDEEVGISLRVTARINEDNRITLDVVPIVEDIIGYAGSGENAKPITSERSVKTRITVRDGETAALGGLLKESEIIKENRVPILGQIPLLGSILFTHKNVQKTTTDLLILITPHLMP